MEVINTSGELQVKDEGSATTQLDNLQNVSINADLTSDTDSAYSFGSSLKKWISGFFDTLIFGERPSAPDSVAGDGQIWVKDDTPNKLKYTDDDATDVGLGVSSNTVNAAGAVMNDDADVSGDSWVVNEGDMTSDLATKIPTQQSVKAYADAVKSSGVASQFMLGVMGGTPSTTYGCGAPTQIEFTTNDIDLWGAAFDPDAQEHMQWSHPLPDDYGGGTVTAKFYWYSPDGGALWTVWSLQAMALGDSDPLDTAWGGTQSIAHSNPTDGDLNITGSTPALTIAGTPLAGEMVQWRALRWADHGSDTITVDIYLLWIEISYTRS